MGFFYPGEYEMMKIEVFRGVLLFSMNLWWLSMNFSWHSYEFWLWQNRFHCFTVIHNQGVLFIHFHGSVVYHICLTPYIGILIIYGCGPFIQTNAISIKWYYAMQTSINKGNHAIDSDCFFFVGHKNAFRQRLLLVRFVLGFFCPTFDN